MKRAFVCSFLLPLMICAMEKNPAVSATLAASPSIVTAAILNKDDSPIAPNALNRDGTIQCGPYVITLGSTKTNVPETPTVWYVVTKSTEQVLVGIKTIGYNQEFRRALNEEHTLKLAVIREINPDTKK
jgi:hypothetical protein